MISLRSDAREALDPLRDVAVVAGVGLQLEEDGERPRGLAALLEQHAEIVEQRAAVVVASAPALRRRARATRSPAASRRAPGRGGRAATPPRSGSAAIAPPSQRGDRFVQHAHLEVGARERHVLRRLIGRRPRASPRFRSCRERRIEARRDGLVGAAPRRPAPSRSPSALVRSISSTAGLRGVGLRRGRRRASRRAGAGRRSVRAARRRLRDGVHARPGSAARAGSGDSAELAAALVRRTMIGAP